MYILRIPSSLKVNFVRKKIVTPGKQYASFPLVTLKCCYLPNLVSRAFPFEKLGRAGKDPDIGWSRDPKHQKVLCYRDFGKAYKFRNLMPQPLKS